VVSEVVGDDPRCAVLFHVALNRDAVVVVAQSAVGQRVAADLRLRGTGRLDFEGEVLAGLEGRQRPAVVG